MSYLLGKPLSDAQPWVEHTFLGHEYPRGRWETERKGDRRLEAGRWDTGRQEEWETERQLGIWETGHRKM